MVCLKKLVTIKNWLWQSVFINKWVYRYKGKEETKVKTIKNFYDSLNVNRPKNLKSKGIEDYINKSINDSNDNL